MHIYIPSIRGQRKGGARTNFRAQTEDEGSIHVWKGECIMNKIYKVVWNAARNSYMVGSEFIRGSHSAGSRRISGRKLKGLVAAALLAGAILSPAGLMPASANWTGYATNEELAGEAYTRYQEDQKLEGDISDLQGQVNSQKSTIGNLKKNDWEQNKDIAGLKQDVAANNRLDAVQSGAIIGGMIHDVVQDAAIDHNYEIDKAQGEAIGDLKQDNKAQWGAIVGGQIHDAIQDGAIVGGMIKDAAQDAAIDHNYAIDKAQGEAIGDLKHENDAQWGAIVGGQIHDAIQDGAIVGGMIHDAVQDAAIDHNYEIDKEQNIRLDTVEEVNKDQQGQLDSVRGEIGQEVADRAEADKELQSQIDDHSNRLDTVEEVNKDQQSQIDSVRGEVGQEVADRTAADKVLQSQIDDHSNRLDTVEEVNKDQQSQIDSVRGEVGQEVADRTAADKELQSQIDDHSNRLDSIEDVNEGQQNQIDNQQKELDAQKEWNEQQDGRLDNVEEEAKKHTTVSTTDSNIQLTETVNDKGGRDYHIALNPDLKVDTVQAQSGSFGNIQINGTDENGQATNTINGLGNTTWDGVNFTSGQAATENQLWTVQQDVNANTAAIGSLNSRVNTLDGRIDKVGANAAALAALHPLDFDPDDKWDFAAGYGNYGNENAMAVGAFYRPNEDTMFSVGGSFGTGENMVNAGVSFKIGQGNHVSTSRVAMAKEIETLRHNVAQLTELVNQLVGAKDQISNSMTTPFSDVPENHWAYETVEQMRERGIVEGYPDGTFGGDRQMTRYEFATIVYRALQKGIGMNEDIQRLVDEFKPELALIRVDTIAQDSEGNPTIERVRVNKA